MTEVSEQSFSAGSNADGSATHSGAVPQRNLRAPIWRFRPALKPVKIIQTVTTQIIPKIALALRSLPPPPAAVKIETEQTGVPLETFVADVLGPEDGAAFAFVEALRSKGATVESIFIELLAPAARLLGEMWESDATDFVSVTLGMSRLQRILRHLGEAFADEGRSCDGGESALLTTIPGEQHSFGLSMVAEFFRRAGWNLCTGPFDSHRELTSLVHNHWFDVVGFSVSSDRKIDELRKGIDDIRRDSRNRDVGIILGGPMMMAHPELVASVGADMMSVDATIAPQQARNLIDQMKCRC